MINFIRNYLFRRRMLKLHRRWHAAKRLPEGYERITDAEAASRRIDAAMDKFMDDHFDKGAH